MMKNKQKYSVRIKLTDFINTDIEEDILYFIKLIHNKDITFDTVLWYYEFDITSREIDIFNKKYACDIESMNIRVFKMEYEFPVWYDIVNVTDDETLKKHKFKSIYYKKDEILSCLVEFSNIIKFDMSKNTIRVKNGYTAKSFKDRNDKFAKMV